MAEMHGDAAPQDSLEALRETEVDLLLVEVGRRTVALPAAAVGEILDPVPATPLPGSPRHVEGVIRVRELVVPLYDLRRRLEVEDPSGGMQLLLLRSRDRRPIAVRVDRVLEIRHLRLGAIAPPPELLGEGARLVLGLLRLDEPALLLDLAELLTSDERLALEELVAGIEASSVESGS